MRHEQLTAAELARRSGVHPTTLNLLLRGKPWPQDVRKGQQEINPRITTIARVAHGLGLRFSYVASRAGLGDEGDRWSNFSRVERAALGALLGVERADTASLDRRLQDFVSSLTKE